MIKAPYAKCDECPLLDCAFVPSYIPKNAIAVAIGEAPGYEETKQGRPFVGPSGRLLKIGVETAGFKFDDIACINVVSCRPPGNREPTEQEIHCCHDRFLYEWSDRLTTIALGKVAKLALIEDDAPRGAWVGQIMPTWHPAYVLRRPSELANLFRDIRVALRGEQPVLPRVDVRHANSASELKQLLLLGEAFEWVSFDIESDNVMWYDRPNIPRDEILMLQLAWCEDYSIVIDPDTIDRNVGMLKSFMDRHKTVAQNGMFDQIFLNHHYGLDIRLDFDTMLAHYVLDENAPHGLKPMSMAFFNAPDYEQAVQQYLKSRNDRYSKVPYPVLAQYGAYDAVYTLKFRKLFTDMLIAESLYEWPFMNVLMKANPLARHMTEHGFMIDRPHLEKWNSILYDEIELKTNDLQEATGHPDLNPNSTQQMAVILWDELKLPINRRTKVYKKTPRSTGNEAVEHLAGHPIVDKLLDLRHVAKINSSYVENLLGFADRHDFCHPSVKLPGTEVGRLAMSDPAAQTIPRASDYYGRIIRSSIVAPPGQVIVICDYSQAELRVLTALSGDPFLLDVYKNDRDLHSEVALAMFGPNYTKEQRVMCKMFNFAYAYGGSEYSFAKDAGLPLDIAKQFVRDYDKNMARAKQWKFEVFQEMSTQGFVTTRFGRQRRFPLITEANLNEVRKSSVHFLVASPASDLTLLSGVQAYDEGINIFLGVHDSLLAYCYIDQAKQVAERISTIMHDMGDKWFPEVPWKVDRDIGTRWVKTHEELAAEAEA